MRLSIFYQKCKACKMLFFHRNPEGTLRNHRGAVVSTVTTTREGSVVESSSGFSVWFICFYCSVWVFTKHAHLVEWRFKFLLGVCQYLHSLVIRRCKNLLKRTLILKLLCTFDHVFPVKKCIELALKWSHRM